VSLPIVWVRAGRLIKAVGRDVNMHGLFICTQESVEPGSLMLIGVTLPERTVDLFVKARFVGRTQAGQGIGVEIFAADQRIHAVWASYYRSLVAGTTAALGAERARVAFAR
jgi:hypothetical protein